MGRVCDICGHVGNAELLAICSQCDMSRHAYCMWQPKELPDVWSCEVCSPSTNVGSPPGFSSPVIPLKPKRPANGKTCKVIVISPEEVIKLNSGSNKVEPTFRKPLDRSSPLNKKAPIPKFPPGFKTAGIDSLYSRSEPSRTSQPLQPRAPPEQFGVPRSTQASKVLKAKTSVDQRRVTFSEQPKEIPKLANERKTCDPRVEKVTQRISRASSSSTHDLRVNNSGGSTCTDADISKSAIVISKSATVYKKTSSGNACADAGVRKAVIEDKRTLNSPQMVQKESANLPKIQPHWKGSFETVSSATPKIYDGFETLLAPMVHPKVLKFSKHMPSKLQFKLLPRCTIWGALFQDESPDGDDIALYIIPEDSKSERSIQNYNYLLEAMELHDSVMCCSMDDGVELLIFTSRLLNKNFQGFYSKSFLWGLFRRVSKQKRADPLLTQVPRPEENTEVDMDIDMIGGMEL